jgi:hypothetical protein
VETRGTDELHAVFFKENRTRGRCQQREAGNPGPVGMTRGGLWFTWEPATGMCGVQADEQSDFPTIVVRIEAKTRHFVYSARLGRFAQR